MDAQIKEDLSYLAEHPMATKDLNAWFDLLCKQGNVAALYCQIRKSVVKWKKTKIADKWRNPRIIQYLNALSSRCPLPDTDFILITADAQETFSKIPVFAFAKSNSTTNVLLFPDFEMLDEVSYPSKGYLGVSEKWSSENPWEGKYPLAFFRGVSTGRYDPHLPDFGNDRARVVLFSHSHPDLVDATFNVVLQPELRDLLNSIQKPLQQAAIADHYKYKYLLDIDGNSCTYSRCRWILLSNSTLVKLVSQNVQWYYKALEPWVHFVPVRQDLSDFTDTLHFLMNHDDIAYKIAREGQELGKTIFSKKLVDLYVVRLLTQYAHYITVTPASPPDASWHPGKKKKHK